MCVILKTIIPIKVKSLVLTNFRETNWVEELVSRITDRIEIVYSPFNLSSFIKSSYHLEEFNFTNSENINGGEFNFTIKDLYRIKIIRTSFGTISYNGDLYFHKDDSFNSFIKAISKSGLKDSLHLITVSEIALSYRDEFTDKITGYHSPYVKISDLVKKYNLTHIKIEIIK